jgi:tRNA nucleotidyltransferase (CCA-adding enzyme)
VRRLAVRVGRIDRLVRVARADACGRPPLPADSFPAGDWLLGRAAALDVTVAAPEPLVLGRHLRGLGAKPGPVFGRVLDACYQAQLDGEITDEAGGLALARRLLAAK